MPDVDSFYFEEIRPPKDPFPRPTSPALVRLNKECCKPFHVLADLNDDARERNDVNSVFDFGDSVSFVLKKEGVITTYTPTSVVFPNESGAWSTTIEWRDVATLDGFGCFSLEITPTVAGVVYDTYTYAQYLLQPFDSGLICNAEGTVRILSRFNDMNDKYGIDMTNAFLMDSLRFDGKFGYFQDNTEIDNIEYVTGEQQKIKREDFTSFELRVNLNIYNVIEKLRDHLLAENSCWITDHNFDNYSFQYVDRPVIVSEGFKAEHFDGTRQIKGVATFEDKVRRNRTHFNNNRLTAENNAPPSIGGTSGGVTEYFVYVNGVLEQNFLHQCDQDLIININ